MRVIRIIDKDTNEVVCDVCGGCGLLPPEDKQYWSMLCGRCNGHGKLIDHKRNGITAYSANKTRCLVRRK